MALNRPYDQEDDARDLSFEAGMPVHLGRVSAALKCMLETPENPLVQALSRAALESFEQWWEKSRPAQPGTPEFNAQVMSIFGERGGS